MQTLENISLAQIAPPSIKYDKNVSAIIEALDPELKLITNETQQVFILSRIDELDEKVLDLLAWQFHVDFYDLANDLQAKRRQVKDSILWHMKKGTAWAIVKALDMIGVDAEFINWYEFGGSPYTFRIKATIRHDYYKYADKENLLENIIRAINEAKAARSLLDKLDAYIIEKANSRLYAGIAQGLSGNEIIGIQLPESPGGAGITFASAQGLSGEKIINISRPDGDTNEIHYGLGSGEFRAVSLGVDLDTMQELLEIFERRIFARLEAQEARIMAEFNSKYQELKLDTEEIKDLLRWEEGDVI